VFGPDRGQLRRPALRMPAGPPQRDRISSTAR
jgi:hypothetical protein